MKNLLKSIFASHRDNVPTTCHWGSTHAAHVVQHVMPGLRLLSLKRNFTRRSIVSVPVRVCVRTTATPAGKVSPPAVAGFLLHIRANLSCRLWRAGLVPFIFLEVLRTSVTLSK